MPIQGGRSLCKSMEFGYQFHHSAADLDRPGSIQ